MLACMREAGQCAFPLHTFSTHFPLDTSRSQAWLTHKSEEEVATIMSKQLATGGDGLYLMRGTPGGKEFTLMLVFQKALQTYVITRNVVGGTFRVDGKEVP